MPVDQPRSFVETRIDEYYFAAALREFLVTFDPHREQSSCCHLKPPDSLPGLEKTLCDRYPGREQELVTKHQVSGEVMGQLVHRGCGKPVPRVQAPDKPWRE